jgi:hypothetical protein
VWATCQIGGLNTYDFLRLPPTARIAALGGGMISLRDADPNFAFQNPAILNDSTHGRISVNAAIVPTGSSFGTASYAHTFRNIAHVWGGVHYQNYGQLQEADEFGNRYGTFGASDVALLAGAARDFGRFHTGMNVKLINSNLYQFSAWAAAIDIGTLYYHEKLDLGVGLVLRNFGGTLDAYTPGGATPTLPFELQVGLSKRVPFTPMRFTLTLTNLETPVLARNDPNAPQQFDLAGNPIPPPNLTVDNIFRHTIFGLEFLLSKHFHLRVGYNHKRRQELITPSESAISMRGVSLGLGLRIWKFNLDYAYQNFHTLGGLHQFSLATYLHRFQPPNYQGARIPMRERF